MGSGLEALQGSSVQGDPADGDRIIGLIDDVDAEQVGGLAVGGHCLHIEGVDAVGEGDGTAVALLGLRHSQLLAGVIAQDLQAAETGRGADGQRTGGHALGHHVGILTAGGLGLEVQLRNGDGQQFSGVGGDGAHGDGIGLAAPEELDHVAVLDGQSDGALIGEGALHGLAVDLEGGGALSGVDCGILDSQLAELCGDGHGHVGLTAAAVEGLTVDGDAVQIQSVLRLCGEGDRGRGGAGLAVHVHGVDLAGALGHAGGGQLFGSGHSGDLSAVLGPGPQIEALTLAVGIGEPIGDLRCALCGADLHVRDLGAVILRLHEGDGGLCHQGLVGGLCGAHMELGEGDLLLAVVGVPAGHADLVVRANGVVGDVPDMGPGTVAHLVVQRDLIALHGHAQPGLGHGIVLGLAAGLHGGAVLFDHGGYAVIVGLLAQGDVVVVVLVEDKGGGIPLAALLHGQAGDLDDGAQVVLGQSLCVVQEQVLHAVVVVVQVAPVHSHSECIGGQGVLGGILSGDGEAAAALVHRCAVYRDGHLGGALCGSGFHPDDAVFQAGQGAVLGDPGHVGGLIGLEVGDGPLGLCGAVLDGQGQGLAGLDGGGTCGQELQSAALSAAAHGDPDGVGADQGVVPLVIDHDLSRTGLLAHDLTVLVHIGNLRVAAGVAEGTHGGGGGLIAVTDQLNLGVGVGDATGGGIVLGDDVVFHAVVVAVALNEDVLGLLELKQVVDVLGVAVSGGIDGERRGLAHIEGGVGTDFDGDLGVLAEDGVIAELEILHALRLDHHILVHVEGVALHGDVLMDGVGGIGQAAALGDGVDPDGGGAGPAGTAADVIHIEHVVADGHIADGAGFVPVVGVVGEEDGRHGGGIEHVVLDHDLVAGGAQDAAGGHILKGTALDGDAGGVGHVLGHILGLIAQAVGEGGGQGLLKLDDHSAQVVAVLTGIGEDALDGVLGLVVGGLQRIPGKELDLVAHVVLGEAALLGVDIAQLEGVVISAVFHAGKGAVHVDGVVVGVGKVTVLDDELSLSTGGVDTVCKAGGDVAGALPGHQVAAAVVHVFTHLDQPAEAVHKVDIHVVGGDIFALPGEGTRGFPVGVAGELDHVALLGQSGDIAAVDHADHALGGLLDGLHTVEGAHIGAVDPGHLVLGLIDGDAVGVVDAGGSPVGLIGVGAELAAPADGVAGDLVGEAGGDVVIHIILLACPAHVQNSHFRDGGHAEVPGQVLQHHIFGVDHSQGHHVAVHHEEGAVALQGQIFLSLNEQADGLDGVFDAVGV